MKMDEDRWMDEWMNGWRWITGWRRMDKDEWMNGWMVNKIMNNETNQSWN